MSAKTTFDLRLVVLIIAGLLIFSQNFKNYYNTEQIQTTSSSQNKSSIIWLETGGEKTGFYFKSSESINNFSWFDIYKAIDIKPPLNLKNSPISSNYISAYNFNEETTPQIIQLPIKQSLLFFAKLPINHSSIDELSTIPGIGPSISKNIIEYRLKHGNIFDKNDLLKIKGVGQKKGKSIDKHVVYY